MTDLRDHSQPCGTCGRYSPEVDHGYLEPQATCSECWGAGGRAVTIDHEAIAKALHRQMRKQAWDEDELPGLHEHYLRLASCVVAAIGDTDDDRFEIPDEPNFDFGGTDG